MNSKKVDIVFRVAEMWSCLVPALAITHNSYPTAFQFVHSNLQLDKPWSNEKKMTNQLVTTMRIGSAQICVSTKITVNVLCMLGLHSVSGTQVDCTQLVDDSARLTTAFSI